jgi:hypothetical protein
MNGGLSPFFRKPSTLEGGQTRALQAAPEGAGVNRSRYSCNDRTYRNFADMPSLSLIAIEARRLVRQIEDTRRQGLQEALTELCEAHWRELRGAEPGTRLARALWSVTPPWADLFTDLYAAADPRLEDIVPGRDFAKGMALLALAEIDRGNESGVQIAHEPMMAFEDTLPKPAWLERIVALLRGTLAPPLLHRHGHGEPLWKALAVIAADTRRPDLPAVLEVIALLAETADQSAVPRDETLAALRAKLRKIGVRFLRLEADHVRFEQHGHAHKPVRSRHLGEMLLEIRQMWIR